MGVTCFNTLTSFCPDLIEFGRVGFCEGGKPWRKTIGPGRYLVTNATPAPYTESVSLFSILAPSGLTFFPTLA